MLLARVAVARGRRFLPFDQALFALGLGHRTGAYLDQPILKGIIGRVRRAIPCQENARMLWNENPDPITRIFSLH